MPAATPEKLVIVATHGGENPEKATIPFVVGEPPSRWRRE